MRIRSRGPVAFAVVATGLTAVAVAGPRLGTGGATAAVATTQASAAATVPYAPYPATGTELYVDNATASNCSDNGAGSQSQPLCTITAATWNVRPGQTVIVEPGTYAGATISAQGTPDAPITFNAIQGATVNGPASAPVFKMAGARDVTLSGVQRVPGRRSASLRRHQRLVGDHHQRRLCGGQPQFRPVNRSGRHVERRYR